MEHKDNAMSYKSKELIRQLNRMQAYGIDSSGLIPDVKESLWNDDITEDDDIITD